jgi:inner membrane protein
VIFREQHPSNDRFILCYKECLEPITHFLTGAVLGRSGFNRKTALATATMTLAAEAPDLDIFWRFKGPVYYFAHHRGFTHSFLGLLLMSALTIAVVYLVWLLRGRKTNIPDLPPRWGRLFLLAYIAGLSHILLDFTNNYGVRPFWPLSEKSYSWDIVFIVEPALYVFLIVGLVLPAIFPRRQRLPRGQVAAVVALLCVAVLYVVRDYEHRAAVHMVRAVEFENKSLPQKPVRASVYPYPWSITHWYTVAEMPGFFASTDVDSRTGLLNHDLIEYYPKPPETPITRVAKQSYLGRVYLEWAQYPLVTEATSGQNTSVHFKDLRFAYPQFRGRVTLSAWVEVTPNLEIVREGFGNREQKPPL